MDKSIEEYDFLRQHASLTRQLRRSLEYQFRELEGTSEHGAIAIFRGVARLSQACDWLELAAEKRHPKSTQERIADMNRMFEESRRKGEL